METVEVVIRIPKNIYEDLFNKELQDWFIESEVNFYGLKIGKAIQNGTVLPKGHGRLVDADKIIYHRCPDNVLDCPQSYDFTCQHCDFGIATKFRTDAIIEADKETK